MITALKQLLPQIEHWPDVDQQVLVDVAREIEATRTRIVSLTPEEQRDLAASLAETERGEFATDAEIRAIWAKHGL